MNSRSAPPRAAVKWMVAGGIYVALGCAAPGGSPTPLSKIAWPAGVDSNAAVFRARVEKNFPLTGTRHERARAAKCRTGSRDSSGHLRVLCSVNVRIEAVGNTLLIDPDNAPAQGVPVARIENLDTQDTEAKFGFRPGHEAIYYAVVDRRPMSTKARWTIMEVPMGGGMSTPIYQADLNLCHPWREDDRRVSDADFYEYRHDDLPCGVGASATSGMHQASLLSSERLSVLFARVLAFVRRESTAAQGGWISCCCGCCT